MSHHELTPKPAYSRYRIAVGWDRPLGTYFAQVLDHDSEPTAPGSRAAAVLRQLATLLHLPARWQPAAPVSIWLGADNTTISDPADIIRAVAPYAVIPDDLETHLALDEAIEGSRHYRP